MTRSEFMKQRNAKMYEEFVNGSSYKILAREYEMTESGVKQALAKHRRDRKEAHEKP